MSYFSLSEYNVDGTLRISCTGTRTLISIKIQSPQKIAQFRWFINNFNTVFEVYFIFRCDHSLCSLFLFNQSVNTTKWSISGSTKMLFLKQRKIQSASSVYFINSSSQNRFVVTWKFKSLVEKVFENIFLYFEESLSKKNKMLIYLFWKSRNLNVRNSKEKQTCFPTRIFYVKTRFLIPIHMQMLTSLFINLLLVPLDLVIIVRKLFAAFWLKNSFVLESWKYQFSLAISLHGLSYYSRYSSLLFPFYSAFMNQILISES